MPYDPQNPASIFSPDGIADFMNGMHNAYRLRHGIPGGDLSRDDVGRSMVALSDAEALLDANAEYKVRPVVSTDCTFGDHQSCEGEESALWPDATFTMRKCSCECHNANA